VTELVVARESKNRDKPLIDIPSSAKALADPSARKPSVSVVINTFNRAASLDVALRSLRYLNYDNFEVIVVNGPSTDKTMEVLRSHASSIRVGTCSDRNLAISRNVGIDMARGELVAFIDDDAVPDPNWLDDAVAGFDCDEVAAVGGLVYDHTGYNLQYRYNLCNRMGTAQWNFPMPGNQFCYPGCLQFPYVPGGNSLFRRSALLEVGAFDEEYDYYLDETDTCLRLIDAGYQLKQLDAAFIYHRSLPSHIRSERSVVTNWFPIIKNKVYFSLKNGAETISFRALLGDWKRFVEEAEAGLRGQVVHGNVPAERLAQFERDADAALRGGIERGLHQPRRLIHSQGARQLRGAVLYDIFDRQSPSVFKQCPILLPKRDKLTVCYLSQAYPPTGVGGIGRLTYDLANGLAERGHTVHVLTSSTAKHNTVDLENNVWVHRLVRDQVEPQAPSDIEVPAHIWEYSARLLRELKRIHSIQPIDIVEGPIWDTEGIAVLVDGSFPIVTNLETPLKVWCETNPGLLGSTPADTQFLLRQTAAEKLMMERGVAHRAISRAIVETLQKQYGVRFQPGQVLVAPPGMEDRAKGIDDGENGGFVNVLFTGRFEHRKGIDVLLQIIPALCLRFPTARFVLLGEDKPQPAGATLAGRFRAQNEGAAFLDRVIFAGKVSDAELERQLARCDVFVAPSRYESFGLVFLEAMIFGKPVVGCRAGGMTEVIHEGVSGLLAEPGDAESLAAALTQLLTDPAKRAAMGQAGRARFLAHFTREKMTDRTLDFYREVLRAQEAREVRQAG